jgi:hypothetical protein
MNALLGLIAIFSCYLSKTIAMEKKIFTEQHIEKVYNIMQKKQYITNEQSKVLAEKFGFCRTIMQRELLRHNIPFKAGKAGPALRSIGILTDGKNIKFSEINNLESWKMDFIIGTKLTVHYDCKNCGEPSTSRAAHMFSRMYFSGEPICSLCISKMVPNLEVWKAKNSDAQFIAQNEPKQKEKNRQAQLKLLENPEFIKKRSEGAKRKWAEPEYRAKMVKIAQDKWLDPIYANKVIQNSNGNFLCGYYNEIYYDSGYELAYLMKMESEKSYKRIQRVNFYISYKDKNGKSRCYYPDFIIDDLFVIEVKGYAPWQDTFENLSYKHKAADEWCRSNNMHFRVVELCDIGNYWYRKARIYHKLSNDKVKKKNSTSI